VKRPLKDELASHAGNLDLKPHVRAYVEALGRIHAEARAILATSCAEWEETIREAVDEYKARTPERAQGAHDKRGVPLGLAAFAVIPGEPPTVEEKHDVFYGFIDRRIALAGKNVVNPDLSRRFATGQEQDSLKAAHQPPRDAGSVGRPGPQRSVGGSSAGPEQGYISPYLIHWTGTDKGGNVDDAEGCRVLSIIASSCELLLSYSPIHAFHMFSEVHEKMVCFTDVPLPLTERHCLKYGRFGIAFHKLGLMNVGAQPVFYASHVWKRDLDSIFRFLEEQRESRTLDEDVLRALRRHFYFTQRLSDGRADLPDTYYYEREWRLGAITLALQEELDRPNAGYWCKEEGYPPYIGKRVDRDGKEYFAFAAEDVAFLIVPADWKDRVENPHGLPVRALEEVAGRG